MAALAGDHVVVKMDDASGTLQTFPNGFITSVDLGLTYDQHDVTGFGDAVHKMINGQMKAPVTLKGYLTIDATNGTHTVIRDAFAQGKKVRMRVAVGDNAAPQVGVSPEYSGEFYIASYTQSIAPGGAVTFVATLNPAIGTAPAWGTMVA